MILLIYMVIKLLQIKLNPNVFIPNTYNKDNSNINNKITKDRGPTENTSTKGKATSVAGKSEPK